MDISCNYYNRSVSLHCSYSGDHSLVCYRVLACSTFKLVGSCVELFGVRVSLYDVSSWEYDGEILSGLSRNAATPTSSMFHWRISERRREGVSEWEWVSGSVYMGRWVSECMSEWVGKNTIFSKCLRNSEVVISLALRHTAIPTHSLSTDGWSKTNRYRITRKIN